MLSRSRIEMMKILERADLVPPDGELNLEGWLRTRLSQLAPFVSQSGFTGSLESWLSLTGSERERAIKRFNRGQDSVENEDKDAQVRVRMENLQRRDAAMKLNKWAISKRPPKIQPRDIAPEIIEGPASVQEGAARLSELLKIKNISELTYREGIPSAAPEIAESPQEGAARLSGILKTNQNVGTTVGLFSDEAMQQFETAAASEKSLSQSRSQSKIKKTKTSADNASVDKVKRTTRGKTTPQQ